MSNIKGTNRTSEVLKAPSHPLAEENGELNLWPGADKLGWRTAACRELQSQRNAAPATVSGPKLRTGE